MKGIRQCGSTKNVGQLAAQPFLGTLAISQQGICVLRLLLIVSNLINIMRPTILIGDAT